MMTTVNTAIWYVGKTRVNPRSTYHKEKKVFFFFLLKTVFIRDDELPSWLSGKQSVCQCRRCRFNPWVRKIPWRRKWQPTPVFLPGESHRQRSLAGYSPWGHKELDTS